MQPFLLGHGRPLSISLLVAEDVIGFDQEIKDYIHAKNGEQLSVSSLVTRRVIYRKGI